MRLGFTLHGDAGVPSILFDGAEKGVRLSGTGPGMPLVACTPVSSIFRHRNARASALTMALSTRGRGAHVAPSGVTTSFRPARLAGT